MATVIKRIQVAVEALSAIVTGGRLSVDVEASVLPTGAATQTTLALVNAILGAANDAIVAAGAVGTISAKLRRTTLGIEELKTQIILAAGENHIGAIGGNSANPTVSFTRPANTDVYSSGDLIANSETAGSVVAMQLTIARITAGSFTIMRMRLHKNSATIANAQFRLHLFKADPVDTAPSSGDNGAIELNSLVVGVYLGYFDYNMTSSPDIQASDIELAAAPANGTSITVKLTSGQLIYALLEARAAYIPTSGEVFTITGEVLQD